MKLLGPRGFHRGIEEEGEVGMMKKVKAKKLNFAEFFNLSQALV